MIPSVEEILKRSNLHISRAKNIYIFGSRVYGTNKNNSDWDIMVIANTSIPNREVRSGNFNIHIVTEDEFLKNLNRHHPSTVECFYAPKEFRLLETIKFNWKPNISSLRHSFSHVSSNSWIKCKKKLANSEYEIGIKSMFHSLRIPLFGIQIAKFGNIVDFSEANNLYKELLNKHYTWDELDIKFREVRNNNLSKFRKVTFK